MIENQTEKTSYAWLVIFFVLSMLALFNAGFDHDVVYYCVFIMSIFMGISLWKSKEHIKLNKVLFYFLLFIIWSFISIVWSISPIRTVIEGVQLLCFLLVYFITQKLSNGGFSKLVRVLFLVAVLIALIGIFKYMFISGERLCATFTNPNPFGIYMVMMFLMALSGSMQKDSKKLNLLSVFFLSVVLLSGSKAAMIAMFIALMIPFLGLDKNQYKSAAIKLVIIFITSFILSQTLSFISTHIRENNLVDQSLIETITRSDSFIMMSVKGRLEFWRVAFELFKNRPILGYGNGTYFSAYYIEYGMNEWYSRFSHNHYLQIASELGVIGIGLFLLFLWSGFKGIIYNAKQKDKTIYFWGMTAGILAFLIHVGADFTWNFPAVTVLFFFFLGIVTIKSKKQPVELGRTVSIIGVAVIIMITTWHYGSIQLYMKALNLENEKSVDSALSLTEKVNRIYPISSFGWSYESDLFYKLYLESNNSVYLDKSFVAMEKALKTDQYDFVLYAKMARLYKNCGDYKMAEKYYLTSTRYSAYSLSNFFDLANMYLELNDKEKAEETLLSALERAPYTIKFAVGQAKLDAVDTIAMIHLTLAKLYNSTGENDKVQEQVYQLIELKEKYPFLKKYFE